MTLVCLSCAWVAGIFVGGWLEFHPPPIILLTGLIPIPLVLRLRHRKKEIILVGLCLASFFGGAIRFESSQPDIDENQLCFYNNQGTVTVKGIVGTDPDVRDKATQIRLSVEAVRSGKEWHQVSGTALLFVPRYPAYQYGDVILVTGKLKTPLPVNDFDYESYLAHQGIYSLMTYPEVEILGRGKGLKPLAWVYSVRNRMSQTLTQVLPEPQASVAQAVTLGIRGNIPLSIKDDFSHTGTTHLLAISGLHLSILAGILLGTGIWLWGRRHYLYIWLALVIIWFYTLISGMNPPIIRAAIMASLFLTADILGRQRSAITAITFAAAIMVAIEPQILWTASFQMSFAAMSGLILVAPFFQALGRKAIRANIGEDRPIATTASFVSDGFSISLGAIIGVGPLIAYYFGIVSFAAIPTTLLALPALPGAITGSAIAGVLGFFAFPVAQVIGWLAWLFISYLLLVIRAFAAIPLSSLDVSLNLSTVWIYYLALALAILFGSNRRKVRAFAIKSLKPGQDRNEKNA
ncbi:MAG: ComEC/Rec2 family competence protein [Dehalococcoidales bacterium]|nr:ComEC/Rec2 family competence protein [Dehalococcoidales bacterium]